MAEHSERGAPDTYEITWENGHVEQIVAHQVAWPNNASILFGHSTAGARLITFHAEVDGRWTLMLQAREADIRTVRNVATESGVSQ